jgi:SAM-dependent methyltransferase
MFEHISSFVAKHAPAQPAPVDLPPLTDLAGYDALVERIEREGLDRIPGDFLEIGCFLGGGTAKLAKIAAAAGKRVFVIDLFDPSFDITANLGGERMADLYRRFLCGMTQEEVFRRVTAPWAHAIHVIRQDSMKVQFPADFQLAFAFVDGNHNPAWVSSDFDLVWRHLVPGGWAGFHDYCGDLPDVTSALNQKLAQHKDEIGRVETVPSRWMLLVEKRPL